MTDREQEKYQKIIKSLLVLPENKNCFTCTQKGPVYVVTQFSIFVCSSCSAYFRNYNFRVKGISLSNFTKEEVEDLKNGGNGVARNVWLFNWSPDEVALPEHGQEKRIMAFIKYCFVNGAWKNKTPQNQEQQQVPQPVQTQPQLQATRPRNPSQSEQYNPTRVQSHQQAQVRAQPQTVPTPVPTPVFDPFAQPTPSPTPVSGNVSAFPVSVTRQPDWDIFGNPTPNPVTQPPVSNVQSPTPVFDPFAQPTPKLNPTQPPVLVQQGHPQMQPPVQQPQIHHQSAQHQPQVQQQVQASGPPNPFAIFNTPAPAPSQPVPQTGIPGQLQSGVNIGQNPQAQNQPQQRKQLVNLSELFKTDSNNPTSPRGTDSSNGSQYNQLRELEQQRAQIEQQREALRKQEEALRQEKEVWMRQQQQQQQQQQQHQQIYQQQQQPQVVQLPPGYSQGIPQQYYYVQQPQYYVNPPNSNFPTRPY
jgi:hypothetical protein